MYLTRYLLVLALSLTGRASATPSTTYAVEPMIFSCSQGPSALECFKRFGTSCDYFCNVINAAPVSVAGGDCSDVSGHCGCVNTTLITGDMDASGLLINSTEAVIPFHPSGSVTPTGNSGHHNHTAGFARPTGHSKNGTTVSFNATRTAGLLQGVHPSTLVTSPLG